MRLKDHAVSFGAGFVSGVLGGCGGSIVDGKSISNAVGVIGVVNVTAAALALVGVSAGAVGSVVADGDDWGGLKPVSFGVGAVTGFAGVFALVSALADDPRMLSTGSEQAVLANMQERPAAALPEDERVFRSASGPVVVPQGIRIG